MGYPDGSLKTLKRRFDITAPSMRSVPSCAPPSLPRPSPRSGFFVLRLGLVNHVVRPSTPATEPPKCLTHYVQLLLGLWYFGLVAHAYPRQSRTVGRHESGGTRVFATVFRTYQKYNIAAIRRGSRHRFLRVLSRPDQIFRGVGAPRAESGSRAFLIGRREVFAPAWVLCDSKSA